MNSELDTLFIILDKIIVGIEYIENKFKNENKSVEIELKNVKKDKRDKLKENYIEKDYTLITSYYKIYKKDYM